MIGLHQRVVQCRLQLEALAALGLIATEVDVEETLQHLVGEQGDTELR